jgi:hypothetical protein
MDTGQEYFAALTKVATYQLEGNKRTLRDSQGVTPVSFVPPIDPTRRPGHARHAAKCRTLPGHNGPPLSAGPGFGVLSQGLR